MKSVRTIGAVLGVDGAGRGSGWDSRPAWPARGGPTVESDTYSDTIYDCGYPIEMTR